MSSAALEKHYRVRELASLWGFSDNTIIRLFSTETGVIRRARADENTPRYQSLKVLPYAFTRDSATSRSRRSFRPGTHFA